MLTPLRFVLIGRTLKCFGNYKMHVMLKGEFVYHTSNA